MRLQRIHDPKSCSDEEQFQFNKLGMNKKAKSNLKSHAKPFGATQHGFACIVVPERPKNGCVGAQVPVCSVNTRVLGYLPFQRPGTRFPVFPFASFLLLLLLLYTPSLASSPAANRAPQQQLVQGRNQETEFVR